MQSETYEKQALDWSLQNKDAVVGSFQEHNKWTDYEEFLFKDISDLKSKICLDFGCGPCRNLVQFHDKFAKIDGVDIAQNNLEAGKIWISHNGLDLNKHKLYKNNGYDLAIIDNEQYDIVMSTICFQHICVYDIRLNILKEIYRILKPNGFITFQMGFGSPSPKTVDYYANHYEAQGTNRECDTEVKDATQIENDLIQIGFKNFKYYVRPCGAGDGHPNWIFFNAQK